MSIVVMTGTPGAGKSYSALELAIVPALEMGRPVVTNIPLVHAKLLERFPGARVIPVEGTTPQAWSETWATIPGGALVVVDEAGSTFPAGTRSNDAGPERDWLALHRHHVGPVGEQALSCEVVLLTQGSSDLARWVRTKIDRTYVIHKLDAVGADRRYRVDVYGGFQETEKPLKRALISSYFGHYQSSVYQYYVSHTAAEVDAVSVKELRADRRTIWSSWPMRAAMAGPFLAIAAIWYGWGLLPQSVKAEQLSPPSATGTSSKGAPLSASPGVLNGKPPELGEKVGQVGGDVSNGLASKAMGAGGKEWRLAAWVHSERRWDVLVEREGARRWIKGARCKDSAGEVSCDIDGGSVSGWTGKSDSIRGPGPVAPSSPAITASRTDSPATEAAKPAKPREGDGVRYRRMGSFAVEVPVHAPAVRSGIQDLQALHAAVVK